MKRLTLIIGNQNVSIPPEMIKGEVEEVLLRLHPRITYKLGRAIAGEDGMVLVEIAIDGKCDLIEKAFKEREWKLPIRFESMRWGWLSRDEELPSPQAGIANFDQDNLAKVRPLDGSGEFPLSKKRLLMRYLMFVGSTILTISLLIAHC